jgi:transposase
MKLIIHEYRSKQSLKDIGYRLNISYPTIMRHINRKFKPRRLKLPEILSIDEFKNLKNGFGKYAFIMVDPIQHKLIDTFPNRRIDNLIRYFSKIPLQERLRVKIVISDLWDPYRRLVKTVFPRAKLVADKYHFIRQLYWGLQDIRKRIMRKYKPGDFNYYILKKYWRYILKYTYHLSPTHFKERRLGYHVTPRQIVDMARSIDDELKRAIDLKDEFYELLHSTSYEDSQVVLRSFIEKLKNAHIPEYFYVAKTYDNWFNEICHSFINPLYNNGFIEGLNNKIKVIKRIAFGYRNFHNFKSRIFALTANDLPLSYST